MRVGHQLVKARGEGAALCVPQVHQLLLLLLLRGVQRLELEFLVLQPEEVRAVVLLKWERRRGLLALSRLLTLPAFTAAALPGISSITSCYTESEICVVGAAIPSHGSRLAKHGTIHCPSGCHVCHLL